MFETVLVAADGEDTDDTSLAAAAVLARGAGATVVALQVTDPSQHQAARGVLEGRLASLDVPHQIELRSGDPAETVLEVAARSPGPLICLTSQGRSALGDMLAGSVTEAVLAAATAPVLVVGPATSAELLRSGSSIVVCVDDTPDCEAVAGPAAVLARALGLGVTLVEVVSPEERVRLNDVTTVDAPTDLGRLRLEEVATMVRTHGAERVDTKVLYGNDVADSVAHFASTSGAAAVAAVGHGRSGLRRLLRGSTALRLIATAPCPVLTVRCDAAN